MTKIAVRCATLKLLRRHRASTVELMDAVSTAKARPGHQPQITDQHSVNPYTLKAATHQTVPARRRNTARQVAPENVPATNARRPVEAKVSHTATAQRQSHPATFATPVSINFHPRSATPAQPWELATAIPEPFTTSPSSQTRILPSR